jgi:tetratricopeptide (TPR) repeat protein
VDEDPCASTYLCVDRAEARADIDPVAAETDLRACLDCPDASPSGYRLLADLARGRGDRAKARLVLLEGRQRFPASASLALALARLERDEGRVKSALAVFAEAAREHPADEIIAREYEAMLARHGTPQQQREAEVQPLIREAAGRFELGDTDGARQTLELALERAKGLGDLSARIHHRLALIDLARGHHEAAATHARRGLDRAPREAPVRFELALTLGEIRMAQARWRPAIAATRAALELDGDNPLAWANLALGLAALGRLDPAIEAFSSAIDHGLSRRLTYAQLSGLGLPFERLSADPRFHGLAVRGWPTLGDHSDQAR